MSKATVVLWVILAASAARRAPAAIPSYRPLRVRRDPLAIVRLG